MGINLVYRIENMFLYTVTYENENYQVTVENDEVIKVEKPYSMLSVFDYTEDLKADICDGVLKYHHENK